ncbi:ComEC/Rec2 family competence protein [Nonomuraea sp. NPDC050328]|uniref:ComEC/Rec2 family competence protein n=1 Tax=Nonomuraea sp. NPDC050328 TaxID=3364361 RepID=UPI00378FC74B
MRLPRWMSEAVAVPVAAQAAVTPVLILMAGQLTLIAIPANLLAGLAVAPATVLGFAAAVVAPVSPEVSQWLVIPAGYAVGWIIAVAGWAAQAPLTNIPWPAGIGGLLLLAVVCAVAVPLWRRWRKALVVVMGAVLAAVLAVPPVIAPWPPDRWLMVMCDVGQGDGLVIAAGQRRGVVVDTGPDPVLMDRCLRDLDIREIPLIVLTHPHADHIGGLAGVLRHRRVGALLVSGAHGAELKPSSRDAPRPVALSAQPGARWTFGPSEVTVLAPHESEEFVGPGEGSMLNNASVVLHVRWAVGSALLSGDIETEAQVQLVRQGVPQADILKVPHHGSARQDPGFLGAVGARAALISVGRGNDYGHPAPGALAALAGVGARVFRTDQMGALAVVERDGKLAIVRGAKRAEEAAGSSSRRTAGLAEGAAGHSHAGGGP